VNDTTDNSFGLNFDYSKNQNDLNIFSKAEKYSHQKEIRLAFQYHDEENRSIKRIDEDTIEISFDKEIKGVIIPTNSFREGFIVENGGRGRKC
jgi:hypothetical protein